MKIKSVVGQGHFYEATASKVINELYEFMLQRPRDMVIKRTNILLPWTAFHPIRILLEDFDFQ